MTDNRLPTTADRRPKGFTLLEVMVALMILALGLASVFSLFGAGAHSIHQAVTDTTISSYATTIFSELTDGTIPWKLPPVNVTDQTHPGFSANMKYDLEFTVLTPLEGAIPEAGQNAVFVTLTIKWPSGPGYQKETFQTVLLK